MAKPTNTTAPDETIHGHGLRMTEQRRAVFDVLMGERDHPTAVEVFTRVRAKVQNISLATVYNCLDTLSGCGLVKTVTHEREPARYCPNLEEHAHFFCVSCGTVSDIPLRARKQPRDVWELPADLTISSHEVSFSGQCPKCVKAGKKATKSTYR
jgi:Fur family transcriptional regulator, peroxide stress response regulator